MGAPGDLDSIRFYQAQGYAFDGQTQFVDFLNASIARMTKAVETLS